MTDDQRIQTGITRGQAVEVTINGEVVRAYEGETIGAVLAASGMRRIRCSQERQDPRGLYCCMGLCYECLVTVDGQPNVRACVTPVQAGQQITFQEGLGRFDSDSPEPHPGRLVKQERQVVIIGAGPAGLSAAIAASRAGARVLVIDENPQPGGQIYRQLPHNFRISDPAVLGMDYEEGRSLLKLSAEVSDRITIWNDALVWAVFEPRRLAVARDDEVILIEAEAIVVATGAYDRPVPVPGWTLPGVMTAGGAQVLLKSQRVRPGRRVLLAGTGPLQLVIANQMLDAGMEVAAVAESAPMGGIWQYLPDLLHQPKLLMRGFKYLYRLKQAKISVLRSHVLRVIEGEQQVQRAVLCEVDPLGNPVPGGTKAFSVDTVCIGYGLIPRIRITTMFDCRHVYNPMVGGWVPYFDDNMGTDQPGVFVAGDGAGVAGVLVARGQGTIAGLFAAAHTRIISTREAEEEAIRVRKQLLSLHKFRRAMDSIYQISPAIYAHVTDDTVVCRCEGVTAGEIRKAMGEGTADLNDIKRRTRAGMGYCQGGNCLPAIASMLSREFGVREEEIKMMTIRPPASPIPLSLLMADDEIDT